MPNEEARIREALLEAAETIAAEDNFTSLDLHEMAAAVDVSPEQLEEHVQDNGELAYRLSLNALRQLRDETMEIAGSTIARMEHYVTGGMEIMVNSSLPFVKEWIADIVDETHDRGSRRLIWGWHVLADILKAGVVRGELREDTPIARLTGLMLAQYYGLIFMWSVLQGSLDAVRAIREYCLQVFPDFLAPYVNTSYQPAQ